MAVSKSESPAAPTRGTMTTADVVFFVLAGVAPMGVVVSLTVLAIAVGNGAGVPGTYLVAGIVLALFAVGYVRMAERMPGTGAFYTYAREGLGVRAGGATAYVAVLAYNAATIGILGSLAYFSHVVLAGVAGIHLSWQLWAAVAVALVAVLAFFEVTLSAKVLGLALLAEVALLLAFDVGVLAQVGFRGFSLHVFAPRTVFGPGFGVTLMLAFGSYVGFEATALYADEAKDRHRSIPRATIVALATITAFYLLTTWAAISAYGAASAKVAAGANPAGFMFAANAKYVGGFTDDAMQLLVVTSLFAAFLAFHCNTARYHRALAQDGLLPRSLAWTHPRHGSPVVASAAQLAVVTLVVGGFAAAGEDPYLRMGAALYGLGVIGIVLLQAIASAAVVGFFLHRDGLGLSRWGTLVAPGLGALGLVAGLLLMVAHYSTLTASTTWWINGLPWLLVVAASAGARVARSRPRAFHAIGERPDIPAVTEG